MYVTILTKLRTLCVYDRIKECKAININNMCAIRTLSCNEECIAIYCKIIFQL